MLNQSSSLAYQNLQRHGYVTTVVEGHPGVAATSRSAAVRPFRPKFNPAPDTDARGRRRWLELALLSVIWSSACLLLLASITLMFAPFVG